MNDKLVAKNNVTWFNGYLTREDREKLHGHKGAVIWFTGLSASGKSTIARHLEKQLYNMDCSTYVFDGDNVRHGLCGDLGFSLEDREENIRRIGEMVNLYVDAGIIKEFTGISAPYEPPDSPDLVVRSHKEDAKEASHQILDLIKKRQIVNP